MIDMNGLETMADPPRVQARLRPDAVAYLCEGRSVTFAAFNERTNRTADQLIAMGLKPGDRIALLSKNTELFFEILFGAIKARVVLAPVNFRLAPPEIAYTLTDAGAKLLFLGADFAEPAAKALAQMEIKPDIIALDGPNAGYAAWRDAGRDRDPMLPIGDDDDVLQLYTSGTTGHPKGVQLTNANYLAFFRLAGPIPGFDYRVGETVMNAMPQFHVAGCNVGMIALASGSKTVIVRDLIPAAVIDLLQRERVNHAFFVPAVIMMLMQSPEMASADLSSVQSVAYGASPIAEDLLVRARERFGCDFLQLYGMTETVGAATYLPPAAHDPALGKLRSCGRAWPGIEVEVRGGDGDPVPIGDVGEIFIRAPVVMKGYWNKPEATAEAIHGGWYKTGDAAYQDAEGFFYIYDRVKDMIVTGGENVYPAEVENAIFGHPNVADVAVIGVPDDKWGEAVKAIVIAKPGAPQDAADIIAWARERVANYKVPKSVDFVDAIPRNPSGKILRRELRAPYWEGRTRMVG
ncbi:MAG: long-chain-fatty-acid--CoA ligase [Alphaproteobacteria bacterium]|nr:long-chain-fatty-acid--CoA ligase [Alphaproteobacteria bacterium]